MLVFLFITYSILNQFHFFKQVFDYFIRSKVKMGSIV